MLASEDTVASFLPLCLEIMTQPGELSFPESLKQLPIKSYDARTLFRDHSLMLKRFGAVFKCLNAKITLSGFEFHSAI